MTVTVVNVAAVVLAGVVAVDAAGDLVGWHVPGPGAGGVASAAAGSVVCAAAWLTRRWGPELSLTRRGPSGRR